MEQLHEDHKIDNFKEVTRALKKEHFIQGKQEVSILVEASCTVIESYYLELIRQVQLILHNLDHLYHHNQEHLVHHYSTENFVLVGSDQHWESEDYKLAS